MLKVLSIVGNVLLAIAALPFVLLAVWAFTFHAPVLGSIAAVAAFVVSPLLNRLVPARWTKLVLLFLLLPATLVTLPLTIRDVDRQVERLDRKLQRSRHTFTFLDRAGVWGLNAVMAIAGYPLYPEAARETLLMTSSAGPGRRRVFESDFGLGSARIRARLRDFLATIPAGDTARQRGFGPARIEWAPSEYRLTDPEARYALALNQTDMYAHARRVGNDWRIDVTHEVEIRYPKDCMVTLIPRPRLRMQEGLFWALQEAGWLHPYTAEWRFTVYRSDPRLQP